MQSSSDTLQMQLMRGQYIDHAIDVEFRIDVMIAEYFRQTGADGTQFQRLILAKVGIADKCETLVSIAGDAAPDVDIEQVARTLRTMCARRDELARRRFAATDQIDDTGRLIVSIPTFGSNQAPGDSSRTSVDFDDFESNLAELRRLVAPLTAIRRAIALRNSSRS